jgi:hypothetical protein
MNHTICGWCTPAAGYLASFVAYVDGVQVHDGAYPYPLIDPQPAVVCSDHDESVTAFVTPADRIGALVQKVADLNLQQGIDNSLDAKLEAAIQALANAEAGDNPAAVNKLEAFIAEVEAQRDKKITDAQADELIGDAQAVIALL